MLFNSVHFLLFFVVVVALYFVVPQRMRWVWLLLASYYFYMCWNPRYALLLAASTIITFASGVLIARAGSPGAKKLWVGLSFGTNLAILFFFKYFYFAVDSLNALLGAAGIQLLNPTFDVLLPVGISFYTFQALGYTVDVYRGQAPEKNILKYALFVSFFPQLVAGPIERSGHLLAQIHSPQPFEFERVKRGLWLMLWGYFEKLVIADRAALLVNQIYGGYETYGSVPLVVGTLAFAVQIYCDFCGYCDIAVGAAEVLGFSLMQNFRRPYFSTSIGEFWRRWHISLSSWFRDYLYIPLGGNRKGRVRRYANVMITFLASGLWHGAGWTFALWGIWHGALLVLGDVLKPLRRRLLALLGVRTQALSHQLLRAVITFGFVCVGWVFFRAPSVAAAGTIIRQILVGNRMLGIDEMGLSTTNILVLVAAVALLFGVSIARQRGVALRSALAGQNLWLRWGVLLCALFAVLIFGIYGPGFDAAAFLYFQF